MSAVRARLAPVPRSEIADPKLQALIARAEETGIADSRFVRLMAHVPGYAEALHDALDRSLMEGSVDHGLKEIVRIQLARLAGDDYFAAFRSKRALADGLTEERIEAGCGDFQTDDSFTPAEKWALRYGWLMYRAPGKVDKAFYDEGKTHYSEAEIVELGAFIAFHYGMQIFFGTLDLPAEEGG